jgi:hypothetical protein
MVTKDEDSRGTTPHFGNLHFSISFKLPDYDSFRWKCHPIQYKFVLEGVTFPAKTVIPWIRKTCQLTGV